MRDGRPRVGALKALNEGITQDIPIAYVVLGHAVKPRPCGTPQHQWEITQSNTLVAPTNNASNQVVGQSSFRLDNTFILIIPLVIRNRYGNGTIRMCRVKHT